MEQRLTKMDTQNRLLAYSISDTGLPTLITSGNPYRKLIEKLKSYEDTGLEPGGDIDRRATGRDCLYADSVQENARIA